MAPSVQLLDLFRHEESFCKKNRAAGACSEGAECNRPQSEATSKSMPNERRKNMLAYFYDRVQLRTLKASKREARL